MSQFNYSDWDACGVGSSVTWEEDSHNRRRIDLPELPPEQEAMLARMVPPDQREMLLNREMSIRGQSEHRAILVERHPDRLVVEIRTRVTVQGRRQEFTRRDILHSTPQPAESDVQVVVSHGESADGNESATVEKHSWADLFKGTPTVEGDETIEVTGKPMRCRWSEQSAQTPAGLFQVRTWRCEEIPGGIARWSLRLEGPNDLQTIETKILSYDRKELRSSP